MINISQNILVMKIEDVNKIVLEIKGAKMKINFQFFKWSFIRMDSMEYGWTLDSILGLFSETIARLLKSIALQFFWKYSKSYNILNAKSRLKLEGS